MLYAFLALWVGFSIGYFFASSRGRMQQAKIGEENVRLREHVASLTATLNAERELYAQTRIDERRKHDLEVVARNEEMATLRQELRTITAELAQQQGAELRAQHSEGLNALLMPLQHSIQQFKDQFVSTSARTETQIQQLAKQSDTLGREAEALVKALKSNTKLQGNWGEQILERLLETSGLARGRDYEVQMQYVNDGGEKRIPDVVVHLPEGRDIVIDSKVSLTAFSSLSLTEDSVEMARLRKEHLRSVHQHIKELSEKHYHRELPKAIGYVLMFIPHEAAYLTALEEDPELLSKAYRQEVILINPSNLFMALQLAYNLWQAERQSQSVADIYASAERLHRKFASFADNFVRLGEGLERMQNVYSSAHKQLTSGKGNILQQLKAWEEKGFMPTKTIALREENASKENEEMPSITAQVTVQNEDA